MQNDRPSRNDNDNDNDNDNRLSKSVKQTLKELEREATPPGVCRVMSQETVVNKSFDYIRNRMEGNFTVVRTFSSRLDKAIGYIEPNTTITISARSGGGKSTLSKRLINSMIVNYTEDCIAKGIKDNVIGLSFNFEMLAHKTVGRELSKLSNLSLNTLYSSEVPLDPKAYSKLLNKYKSDLINTPLVYVEEPATYTDIGKTILHYWNVLCKAENKLFIVEIDHAMITKGKDGDVQKDRVDNLMDIVNTCKKTISSQGGNVIFIVLSQMNRDIISKERLLNPSLQYPNTSDLFGSSAIEFYSDYILVAHNPSRLHLQKYTDQELPIYVTEPDGSLTDFIYFHLLKNRDGVPDQIVPFLNRLHRFDFEDIDKTDFFNYHSSFRSTGVCNRIVQNTIQAI
jgi:replicative DNA helicase